MLTDIYQNKYVQTGRKRPRPSKQVAVRPREKPAEADQNDEVDTLPTLTPLVRALCKQDPFDSASVRLDDTISGLLHYYV